MLFNLETDTGSAITGYIVPDGASAVPSIRVRARNEDILIQPANELRVALVAAGRHQTGECGFRIDESTTPGLAEMDDLEIYDTNTQILVYRRPRRYHLAKKILRLETHLYPIWLLDQALKEHFQYSCRSIESFGRETTTQLFLLNHVNSIYLSGRILYKNYRSYIESNFATVFIMHNPYEEMAERLLVLRHVNKVGAEALGMRESLSMQSTIEFAQSLPVHDEKSMTSALRKMPASVGHTLANPVLRQLTTATPDELPNGRSVSTALDILASFSIVALRRDPDIFLNAFAELLGIDSGALPEPTRFSGVATLARALKRSRQVDLLLETDLELYQHVSHAFKNLG